jgi:D-tyrosyl-tRNA(Tyr) deacylase
MRAVVQRVLQASVSVGGAVVGEIGAGVLVLICAIRGDGVAEADKMAGKVARLRIFRDAAGRMNRSLADTGGAALVVSQFTLAADMRSGNRPGFSAAAEPDEGARLYQRFAEALAGAGVPVAMGQFGADMAVALVNDGPVTIWIEV